MFTFRWHPRPRSAIDSLSNYRFRRLLQMLWWILLTLPSETSQPLSRQRVCGMRCSLCFLVSRRHSPAVPAGRTTESGLVVCLQRIMGGPSVSPKTRVGRSLIGQSCLSNTYFCLADHNGTAGANNCTLSSHRLRPGSARLYSLSC